MKKRLSTLQVLLISAVIVALAAILPLFVSGYILGLLTVAFYFGVFAMAWDLLFGFAGEVNFGPTFLIGVGAYTAGILDNLYQPPIILCLAAGTFAAIIGGVVLALPALRLRGPYFGLITLVAVLILSNFIVVAAVIGGRRTILGGVLGAVFLIGANELLRPLGDMATFIVSAIALVVVLLIPGGFLGVLSRGRNAA
jgi:branched-chain amino acid transport system permease protein